METSAKTGDGVGDCFYILACLMVGQGVPDQLIANKTVFSPGRIILEDTSIIKPIPSDFEYEAPPVPEISTPQSFISDSQDEYEAPPVPEPVEILSKEPEVEYEAPPVPEPIHNKILESAPKFEPESPKMETPEPTEIEFRTPDEILSETPKEPRSSIPIFETLQPEQDEYIPKTAPFTSNIPTPVAPPEEFRKKETESPSPTPFRVIRPEEPTKPQPSTMTFHPPTEPESDSLIDYMPQTIISKKEKKKLAKEKKKKEKEKAKLEKEKKIQEERERQEKLLQDMKSKKGESLSTIESQTSSLFQTLTQARAEEDTIPEKTEAFIPFVGTEKKEDKKSTLRIIPNVADIESETSSFTSFTTPQTEPPKSQSQDLLVCEQCGAVLSADYAFCNKCGNKLT